MENAGRATAQIALQMLGGRRDKNAIIACGKGNNGGDGYVIARYLLNAGHHVRLFLTSSPEEITGCAGTFLKVVQNMGLHAQVIADTSDIQQFTNEAATANLVVDALLGTGLSGNVRSPFKEIINVINISSCPSLSVDIPSGLDANRGTVLGTCVRADATATYAGSKTGFYKADGPNMTGRLSIIDIGIPTNAYEALGVQDLTHVFTA